MTAGKSFLAKGTLARPAVFYMGLLLLLLLLVTHCEKTIGELITEHPGRIIDSSDNPVLHQDPARLADLLNTLDLQRLNAKGGRQDPDLPVLIVDDVGTPQIYDVLTDDYLTYTIKSA